MEFSDNTQRLCFSQHRGRIGTTAIGLVLAHDKQGIHLEITNYRVTSYSKNHCGGSYDMNCNGEIQGFTYKL